jgi:sigma-B regulation protein RsbU (phosphoserine phosphatase)
MNTALLYIHLARNSRPALWTAQIVNAGLIAPLLRRDEQCDYLDIGGLPLGVLPELIGYTKTELALQANDWLVLCSDGLIEAMNKAGEMYGLERLKKRVAAFRPGQAHDLMDWITADVQTFVNNREVHDDMTVVVIHFKGVVN